MSCPVQFDIRSKGEETLDFQAWKSDIECFFVAIGECNDELSMASLLNDDGSGFECEISTIMACQCDIVGRVDMISRYRRVMRNLFGEKLGWP